MRVALLLAGLSAALTCQAQKTDTLTTRLSARLGYPDAATVELMVQVLQVEKHQLEINDPRLAGRVFHLKSQEFRNGVAQPEQDLLGPNRDRLKLDAKGHFACNVYARPATDDRLEVKFFFPTMGKQQQFTPLPSAKAADYSLRTDILPYQQNQTRIPVGRRFPVLVYTLPYEKDGFFYYCDLAQSKVPPAQWFQKFGVRHFVVYTLALEE